MGADAAGERIQLFNRFKVVAVEAHALHYHKRLAVVRLKAYHNAAGYGIRLAVYAVCAYYAAHCFLNAECFRAAERKLIAYARGNVRQKIIVHI